ncbi:MAG: NAD(P)-dependent alcohol dehydrogenase [Ilumatobacter sp.]|nr:NAD(P)-dependent alcohol dehydrogenase [Ilumatobacter sp.]
MRAVTYERYGGPDVLSVDEVERPVPGPKQLLIEVEAVEATKTDCELRSFRHDVKWFKVPLRLAVGVFRPRSKVLGMYFAGTIAAVGADVDDFAVGDAVYGSSGLRGGAYGEYVAVPAKAVLSAKPATLTFAEAAAVPLGALNALHFMRLADVRPGERVLVNGAGGVIGAFGVQIATAMGGAVTGVDAAHKQQFVRSQGAVDFVDYRTTNVIDLDERFDVIFDMIPSASVSAMLDLLTPHGRYAHGNPRLTTLLRSPLVNRRSDRQMIVRFAAESRAGLRELADRFDTGELRPIVDRILPMEDAAEAHRLVETEQRIGAVVLAIGDRAHER